ncbi:MAG: HYR domain-containing protein [Chitinophagales bacterium]
MYVAKLGGNTVTLTVTDNNNNVSTCTATVTVEDNVNPVATCQDVTIQLDGLGAGSITTGDIDNGSNDACGIASLSLDNTSFGCSNVGAGNTVTLTVTDNNNNVSTCTASVTVEDNVNPVATCQDVTVQLDGFGAGSITTGDIDNGSSDACGIANLSLDNTSFGCSNVGAANTVTLTVTDNNNNVSTCSAVVTVEDNISANAICQDVTIYLDGNGDASTTATAVDNGSSDACGIANIVLSQTAFDCSEVGGNAVTLTVTDVNNNVSICNATVTVVDDEDPVIVGGCPSNITTFNSPQNCNQLVSWGHPSTTDNCGVASTVFTSPGVLVTDFGVNVGAFGLFSVGVSTVTYTVTDDNNNVATCTFTITVEDTENPTITGCPSDINIGTDLGICGAQAFWTAPTASDNCPGVILTDNGNFSGQTYPVGSTTVTYTATDNVSLQATCSFNIIVSDDENPSITCPAAVSVTADAGVCEATGVAIGTATITDNCPGAIVSSDALTAYPVGVTTVTWTATDAANNTSSCTQTITVTDDENPTISCPASFTQNTDANACDAMVIYSVTGTDNCIGEIITQTAGLESGETFPLGTTTNTFVITDVANNTATCSFDVTIEDKDLPSAICQDVTVQLDGLGAGSTSTGDIDNGSNDACGIASLSLDVTSFGCSNVGANTVTLTVTDNNSNVSTCTATVTVEDNVNPAAICQGATVQLDGLGVGSISTGDIDNGSNDACGIASLSLDVTSFGCSNVGANTVTLTVTDNNNNVSTCTATVTVEDNVAPVATCQDVTVQLDGLGAGNITTGDIDNGSNDACGVASLSLDVTSFGCSNVGANTVTLTVTDNNSNVSTCTATVTVEDNVDPTAICQDVTVQLDGLGVGNITTGDIDNGSSDACGVANLSLDNTSFGCSNVGGNTVTLTVTDNNNNLSTCTATVTVEDNVAPVAICQDVTVQLDGLGAGNITTGDIDNGSNDACGIASLSLDVTSFDCSNVGANTVELTVTDNNTNVSTCTATVTVEDNVAPVAVCQDATVELDINGNAVIVNSDINNGSNDACGIASLSLDVTSFDCSNVGLNAVVLTVTDNNSNVSTCSATVTVEDNISPNALCQDITVQLDVNGQVSIVADNINNGSTDNCAGTATVNNALPWINEVNHIEQGMLAVNQVEIIYDASLDLNAYSLKSYIGNFSGTVTLYNSNTLALLDLNAVSIGNGLKMVVVDAGYAPAMLTNNRAIAWGLFNGNTPIEIVSWQGIDPTTVTTSDGYGVTHDVMFADNITNVDAIQTYTIVAERCGTGTPSAITNWTSTYGGTNNNSLGATNGCQTITTSGSTSGLTLSIDQSDFVCSEVGAEYSYFNNY